MMIPYILLLLAILSEIIATTSLKLADGFTKLYPSLAVILFYSLAFWMLSITLKTLPVSVVYAIWSGLGIIGIAVIGVIFFQESFTWLHFLGTSLIIVGVAILCLITQAH